MWDGLQGSLAASAGRREGPGWMNYVSNEFQMCMDECWMDLSCVVIVVVGNGYKFVASRETCVPIVDEGTLIKTMSS